MADDRQELEELRRLDELERKAAGASPQPAATAASVEKEPSTLAFIGGNLNKGIADLAGLPVDFARNVINLGIAGVGAATGTTPDLIEPGVGSSQWWEDYGRKIGLIPTDADPESALGRIAASGLRAIPSALIGRPNLAQAPRAVTTAVTSGAGAQIGANLAPEGQEQAGAILGSLLPGARRMGATPSAGERAAKGALDTSFQKAREMGIPVPPRAMKVDQPQVKMQREITKELGLPEGTNLSPETLKNYRSAQYDYGWSPLIHEPALNGQITTNVNNFKFPRELSRIAQDEAKLRMEFPESTKDIGVQSLVNDFRKNSFTVDGALSEIKRLREGASNNLSSASATDDTMRLGLYQRKLANALEDLVADNLKAAGKMDVLKTFQDSRKAMAQAHDVESALEPSGKINAAKLAAIQSEKGLLSGGLKTVADVAASFPSAVRTPTGPDSLFTHRMSPWAATHPQSAIAHLATRMLEPITLSRPYQEFSVNALNRLTPEQERLQRLTVGNFFANQ